MNKLISQLDTDAVLKGQGADPQAVAEQNPALINVTETALNTGLPLIKTAVFRKSLPIVSGIEGGIALGNNTRIESCRITEFLCSAEAVECVVCTIGESLETQSAALFGTDAALALALDGLGNAAVDKLVETICADIEEEAQF